MNYNISQILTGNANKELDFYIGLTNDRIESIFKDIDNASMLFLSNSIIRSSLENKASEDYQRSRKKQDIENEMKRILLFNNSWDSNLMKSIFIYEDRLTYYSTFRIPLYSGRQVVEMNNIKIFEASMKELKSLNIFPPTQEDQTIYFVRNINNLNNMRLDGTLILGIDEEVIKKVYDSITPYDNLQVFIMNDDGVILSHIDKNMLGKTADKIFITQKNLETNSEVMIENEKYIIATRNIPMYDLTSVIAIPSNQILQKLRASMRNYFLIVILAILIFLIIGLFISYFVTIPIKDIIQKINDMKNRNFNTKMPRYKVTEIDNLSVVFNEMTDEIQFLISQVYEKQLLLKESELKSLQSQVNPHFLFNVFETISWEARSINNEKIYKMITSLGEFLRATISLDSREKIKISEEVKHIEFYLYLQKMRFGEKFHSNITISDKSILNLCLPKLCIQPIVENATVHGLENKIGNGTLDITIERIGSDIRFTVVDDGIGFNPQFLNLDSPNAIAGQITQHTSIGLYNANRRIKLLYGDNYGITVKSEVDTGTRVTILIPEDRGECLDV